MSSFYGLDGLGFGGLTFGSHRASHFCYFKELHHPPVGAWFVAVFAIPPGLGPVPKHSSKGAAVRLPVLRLSLEVGNRLGLGSCDDVKERVGWGVSHRQGVSNRLPYTV